MEAINHFHEAIALDSSMRTDAPAGLRGSIEPKPPGIPKPADGRSAEMWAHVSMPMNFFAAFFSPSLTRSVSSCVFFSRFLAEMRVLSRSVSYTHLTLPTILLV